MKLLVIDCKTLVIRKFEDRKFVSIVQLQIEDDTTPEGLKEVLETYRTA
jgi:hypothetical protein